MSGLNMSLPRRLIGAFLVLWVIVGSAVPARAFDPAGEARMKFAITIPLQPMSQTAGRAELLVKVPRYGDGIDSGYDVSNGSYLPLVGLDFGSRGASGLAVGGFTLWRIDRLHATDGDGEDGVNWGTVAWVVAGLALAAGIGLAIAAASDDDPYGLEEYCRELGGTIQNGQCIIP